MGTLRLKEKKKAMRSRTILRLVLGAGNSINNVHT